MTGKSLRTFPQKTTTSSPLTKGSSSCLGTSTLDAPDLKGMNWTLEPMLPTVCVSKPLPSSSHQHQSKFEDKSLLLSTFPVGHWKIDRKLHPGKVGHQVPLRQGIVRTGPSFPHFNVLQQQDLVRGNVNLWDRVPLRLVRRFCIREGEPGKRTAFDGVF